MTYIQMSNEIMAKQRKIQKKGTTAIVKSNVPSRAGKYVTGNRRYATKYSRSETSEQNNAKTGEALTGYGIAENVIPSFPQKSFRVTRAGKKRDYTIQSGYGYFIPSLRKAGNLVQVAELVENGIPSKEIEAIIDYLEMKVPEIAKAAAVSASTVSRWGPKTPIGVSGSNQFFKIDEVIKKGVDLFGSLDDFKSWLNMPNIALGNAVPAHLITSVIGVELVDEAIDALHYGNVI